MNRCRSKGFVFRKKKDVIKSLLPVKTLEKVIEHWWVLNIGFYLPEEEKGCTGDELEVLEELRRAPKQAGIFNRSAVFGLVARGLVFIDVPISNSDTISVPPLEGFVMNRVSGDHFENLLYKIFVSIDERTNIQQLSELLQVDVELIKQAASLYCRLGFAKKKNLEPLVNNHAVTMFEVGKLANEALGDFLAELDKIDTTEFVDGEAKRYASSAIALRELIRYLRENPHVQEIAHGVDLISAERINSLDESMRARVLSKNYSVLLSMSPLSTDTSPVISCHPPHFGAAIYEAHSFWLKLYLYSLVGAGPASLLLPRGSRLRSIPACFRDCEKVRVCSLDHDSTNVNLSQLLPSVSETLLSSPVLLQAFSYVKYAESRASLSSRLVSRDQPTLREALTIIDVPFPLDPLEDGVLPPDCEEDYTPDTIHLHPHVRAIEKLLDLTHSIGYISMLRKEVADPIAPDQVRTTWLPYNVYFGVPIFDNALNAKVCAKIEKFNLLSAANIVLHNRSSRLLSLNLLKFISSTCPPVHPDLEAALDLAKINSTLPSVQNLPLPTQTISFVNGVLEY
eukprot:gene17258-20567_t